MSLMHSPSIVTSGLVICLDAGNPKSYPGSGTAWTDVSGNNRNGVLVNGVAYNSSNGGSLVFDGVDDYVSVTGFNVNHGTSDFSYCCWVNLAGKPSLGTIFENGFWQNCVLFRYETNGVTLYSMNVYFGKFTFDPTLGTWNHLAFVRSGNNVLFYVNGVYQQQLAFGTNLNVNPSPANLFIGTSQHVVTQCFNGRISFVNIYNAKALSADEVLQNFNAQRGRYGV